MIIKNHIAYRFLTDQNMTFEIVEHHNHTHRRICCLRAFQITAPQKSFTKHQTYFIESFEKHGYIRKSKNHG